MYNTGLFYKRTNKIKKTKLHTLLELGQRDEISVFSVLLWNSYNIYLLNEVREGGHTTKNI